MSPRAGSARGERVGRPHVRVTGRPTSAGARGPSLRDVQRRAQQVTRPSAEPSHPPYAMLARSCHVNADRSAWVPPTDEPGNLGSGSAQVAPDSCVGTRVC